MALLCYGLLIAAWIADILTPQLFIVAILFNGPIALSSLALRSRLTTNLVVAAEVANVFAGYLNGVQSGHHWDGIAVGDRLLLAASFVLVGYLSVKTQEYGREAGVSAGRMRQIEIEKALRGATERVRETLNVELVQRAITRESVGLLGASKATLVVRQVPFQPPLVLSYNAGDSDVAVERRALSTELASLIARAVDSGEVLAVTDGDLLGRATLEALGASEALAASIATNGSGEQVLVASVGERRRFVPDAMTTLRGFAGQATMALEQARLFSELGDRNEEIARQKDELANRSDVIRDIVYALAHDLRTPLAAAHVTMKQALSGAYGQLPERYGTLLQTALVANEDERRIVETLLLVARYEAGEFSTVREAVSCGELLESIIAEFRPLAEVKGVNLGVEISGMAPVALGDPHELRRAIVNLVANALDATPRGGHVVARCASDRSSITIAVEDDGFGVPEKYRGGTLRALRRWSVARGHGAGLVYRPANRRKSWWDRILCTAPTPREPIYDRFADGCGVMPSPDRVRVVIVEDHALTRAGLKTALEGSFDVVDEAADGLAGWEAIVLHRPDVAVIDIGIPALDGVALTKRVRAAMPQTHVVILTMIDLEDEVLAALAAGADAYCLKSSDPERILDAVRIASEGGAYFDPTIAHLVLSRFSGDRRSESATSPLTPRETQILRLISDGRANVEIAERLHIGLGTVKGHIRDILDKLSASDRTQAAVLALRRGYI